MNGIARIWGESAPHSDSHSAVESDTQSDTEGDTQSAESDIESALVFFSVFITSNDLLSESRFTGFLDIGVIGAQQLYCSINFQFVLLCVSQKTRLRYKFPFSNSRFFINLPISYCEKGYDILYYFY